MAKAQVVGEIDREPAQELCLLALPLSTFRQLSNTAALHGLTLSQLLAKSVDHYLRELSASPAPVLGRTVR
jgi:hypothetical protein